MYWCYYEGKVKEFTLKYLDLLSVNCVIKCHLPAEKDSFDLATIPIYLPNGWVEVIEGEEPFLSNATEANQITQVNQDIINAFYRDSVELELIDELNTVYVIDHHKFYHIEESGNYWMVATSEILSTNPIDRIKAYAKRMI